MQHYPNLNASAPLLLGWPPKFNFETRAERIRVLTLPRISISLRVQQTLAMTALIRMYESQALGGSEAETRGLRTVTCQGGSQPRGLCVHTADHLTRRKARISANFFSPFIQLSPLELSGLARSAQTSVVIEWFTLNPSLCFSIYLLQVASGVQ